MSNLFEIATAYRALAEKLHDTDLPDEVIEDTLEAESGDLVDPVSGLRVTTEDGAIVISLDAAVALDREAHLKSPGRLRGCAGRRSAPPPTRPW